MRSKCDNPRQAGAKPSARPTLAAFMSVALGLSVAACSTLNSQIFPQRLLAPKASRPDASTGTDPVATAALNAARKPSGHVPLPDALAEAEQVQSQYAQAISEQTQYRALSDVGVISMTAAAVVTSLTGASKHAIVNYGGGAALAHVLSTNLVSVPRLKIYASGVTALGCAIASSEKFVLPDEVLGDPGDTPQGTPADKSLRGLVRRAQSLSARLSNVTGRLVQANVSEEREEFVGKPAAAVCATQVLPSCLPGNASTPAAMKQCQNRRAALAAQCAGTSMKKLVYQPHPDIAAMVARLEKQRGALNAQADALTRQIVVFDAAGGELRRATLNIAMGVNDQVLETLPDPATVLNAAKSLKSTAFELTGAPVFAATAAASAVEAGKSFAAGKPGSKSESWPNYGSRPTALLEEAENLYRQADDYIGLMHSKLKKMTQQQSLSRAPLESCGYQMGLALTLIPDVAEVSMEPGQVRTFAVSSPTGLAVQASAVPGLTRDPSGTFTYKASATAVVGSVETLHFADATGRLTRDVIVRIVKPATSETTITAATVDIGSMDQKRVAEALNLPGTSSASDVGSKVESCLRDKFSISSPARDKVPATLVPRIMNGECRGA